MKNFALMIFAAVAVLVGFVPLLIIQSIRYVLLRKSLNDLWMTVALGLDQVGGSIIYAQDNWTVSSCTGFYASQGNKYAKAFEWFIDLLFGKDHCVNAYKWEKENNKEGL